MKGNTLLYVILALVVAVIGWMVYKGRSFNILKQNDTPTPPAQQETSLPNSDVEAILAYLPLTEAERASLRSWIRQIKTDIQAQRNGWSQQGQAESAEKLGITYDQGLVVAAIYQLYATSKKLTRGRYTELYEIIVPL